MTSNREMPDSMFSTFLAFASQMSDIRDLVEYAVAGLSSIGRLPPLLVAPSMADEVALRALFESKRHNEFVTRQRTDGFPQIHGMATVALWSSLEAFVENFISTWLQEVPNARDVSKVAEMTISIADYSTWSQEELWLHVSKTLLAKWERSGGINTFEEPLKLFGLGGQVAGGISADLFELKHVRNLLVHRNGVVDREFVPKLGPGIGETLVVSPERFEVYHNAVLSYGILIVTRAAQALPPTA